MDATFSTLLQLFLAESERSLREMQQALGAVSYATKDRARLDAVRRGAHTLTRGAAALGFESVAAFAHVVEELAERLVDGGVPVTEAKTARLQRAVIALSPMVREAVDGREELLPAHVALLERLREAATT